MIVNKDLLKGPLNEQKKFTGYYENNLYNDKFKMSFQDDFIFTFGIHPSDLIRIII